MANPNFRNEIGFGNEMMLDEHFGRNPLSQSIGSGSNSDFQSAFRVANQLRAAEAINMASERSKYGMSYLGIAESS